MTNKENKPEEDNEFDFDMQVGPLTLMELILIIVGFCVALTVLVNVTSELS